MTSSYPPLVVDLDGTLTPTDTLLEAMIRFCTQSPLNIVRLFVWMLKGRTAFKTLLANRTTFSAQSLPYREPLLAYLRSEKANGRQIILATASHKTVASEVAGHLDLFDEVIATDETANLKGVAKLAAIRERVGEQFAYAGDSTADLPIWKAAKAALIVGASASVSDSVRGMTTVEKEFPRVDAGFAIWSKQLRVYQWLKNLLIFVPVLTAFAYLDARALGESAIAFLSFSLTASATYIVNDLWDLDSDREHPRKRFRPLATAEISISKALGVATALLVIGVLLALWVSDQFLLMLLLYLVITSSYSWVLKSYVLIDVIVLSLLYMLRVLAGSVAIEVQTSTWLLAFSVFVFLSLALVKRCAELVSLSHSGREATSGRDYRVDDLVVLWPLGVGAAVSAVVVFGLFISVAETAARYGSPLLLWLVALGLIYWLSRLWIKTARGEMHDDPVVYALKDHGSRTVVMAMLVVMLAAHHLEWETILG